MCNRFELSRLCRISSTIASVFIVAMLQGCDQTYIDEKAQKMEQRAAELRTMTAHNREILATKDRAARWQQQLTDWKQAKVLVQAQSAKDLDDKRHRALRLAAEEQGELLSRVELLLEKGDHGPPGTSPHFLSVLKDDGGTAEVRNDGSRTLSVRLSGVVGAGHGKTISRCLLSGDVRSYYTNPGSVELAPGEARLFSKQCGFLRGPLLEFEVRADEGLIWATDTVMEELLGLPPGGLDLVRRSRAPAAVGGVEAP